MKQDKDVNFQQSGNFGQRLRRLRKSRKLSLVELGERSGLSFSHLSRYERGVTEPSGDGLQRLSEALQVSVAALMDDEAPARMADLPVFLGEKLNFLKLLADLPVSKRVINAFLFQHRVKNLSAAAV